jgi:hypothetical protein
VYFTCSLGKKKRQRFSGIDSGQRRKCIRVYRLLQGEGVMDRSALPVSACLTRRNGCTVPPSTMQKISCTVMRSSKAVPSGDERRGSLSYVGLRAVREHGNEEAAMESMGNALRSKSMREGSSSFQESTCLRHCGEKE